MSTDRRDEFDFDVALSFAGEDREYVEEVNAALRNAGVRTFLDSDYLAETWGEDLVEYFDDIFRERALYAMLFVSRFYAQKSWPRHERRSALARALDERSAYVLPIRLDDSDLDGLRPTVGYADARRLGIDGIVAAFVEKLTGRRNSPEGWPGDRVPRTQLEVDEVRLTEPPGWEYLYFAGNLFVGKERLENQFLDYELGYASRSGMVVDDMDAFTYMSAATRDAGMILGLIKRLSDSCIQEQAFGAPGVKGDADRIKKYAERWVSVYEELLEWSARLRGTNRSERFDRAFELLSKFVDNPIHGFRSWVDHCVAEMDRIPEAVRSDEPFDVKLTWVLDIDDRVQADLKAEMARIERELMH